MLRVAVFIYLQYAQNNPAKNMKVKKAFSGPRVKCIDKKQQIYTTLSYIISWKESTRTDSGDGRTKNLRKCGGSCSGHGSSSRQ